MGSADHPVCTLELRTPVATVVSDAQLLDEARAQGRLDTARLTCCLGTVRASADHLARLTRDLLEVSQLRTGKVAVQPRSLDLIPTYPAP